MVWVGKKCWFPNPELGKKEERVTQLRQGGGSEGIAENNRRTL